MAVFLYEGKDLRSGRVLKGEVEANSIADAKTKVTEKQLVVLKILIKGRGSSVEAGGKQSFFTPNVKPKELQIFTRQLSVLVGAGVPIVQSLESLVGVGRSKLMNQTIQGLVSSIQRGKTLAISMKSFPNVFNKMFISLILAGEEGGVLDTILLRLAQYIEKSVQLKSKIKRGLWYPGIIVFVAVVVVVIILTFVIPVFADMFGQLGRELPRLTVIVINISYFFQTFWFIIFGAMVAIPFALKWYYNSSEGRKVMDSIFINLPVFGSLINKAAVARFSRTLSTLLGSGIRVSEALDIAAPTSGNYLVERDLLLCKDYISKGKSMSEPLKGSKYVSDMVAQMIFVGEQTGNIDHMLEKIADFYEDEVDGAADVISSLIEPILMVALGVTIAFLVGAMYLPIFDIASVVSGE